MSTIVDTTENTLTAEQLTAFEPTGSRTLFLDQRMRKELSDSVRYVFAQAKGLLTVPPELIQPFLARLENHPISPLVFSFYSDAVLAIEEDDLADASRLLTEMVQFPPHPGGPLLIELADPAQNAHGARIARLINSDPSTTIEILPPSRDAADTCRRLIHEAFALMDAGDPAQAAETRGLLREIILGAGTLAPAAMTFDGASHFMLWGGIIINANQRDSALAMVQMLVHEGSHNLLFGLCTDEPLVENTDDELYSSPLRVDPRPMDGIYHATFVTARMHRVVKRLLDSGTLPIALQEKARKELADNARLFAAGIATVRQHARLTSLGKAVMQGAIDYMEM